MQREGRHSPPQRLKRKTARAKHRGRCELKLTTKRGAKPSLGVLAPTRFLEKGEDEKKGRKEEIQKKRPEELV